MSKRTHPSPERAHPRPERALPRSQEAQVIIQSVIRPSAVYPTRWLKKGPDRGLGSADPPDSPVVPPLCSSFPAQYTTVVNVQGHHCFVKNTLFALWFAAPHPSEADM